MVFNYTLPTNVTSFSDIGVYLNDISTGYFGFLLIAALFFICVISFSNWNMRTNLLTSSWIGFLASLLLWLMGWSSFVLVIVFMIAVASIILLMKGEEK